MFAEEGSVAQRSGASADLDAYLIEYNYDRAHTGRPPTAASPPTSPSANAKLAWTMSTCRHNPGSGPGSAAARRSCRRIESALWLPTSANPSLVGEEAE